MYVYIHKSSFDSSLKGEKVLVFFFLFVWFLVFLIVFFFAFVMLPIRGSSVFLGDAYVKTKLGQHSWPIS